MSYSSAEVIFIGSFIYITSSLLEGHFFIYATKGKKKMPWSDHLRCRQRVLQHQQSVMSPHIIPATKGTI